tara:strand:+ start:743 stop:901 length:159 start_codon:yes stop_codon:yes gene_type:complete
MDMYSDLSMSFLPHQLTRQRIAAFALDTEDKAQTMPSTHNYYLSNKNHRLKK